MHYYEVFRLKGGDRVCLKNNPELVGVVDRAGIDVASRPATVRVAVLFPPFYEQLVVECFDLEYVGPPFLKRI